MEAFYCDDENSRACLRKRDVVRVTGNGENIQKQGRLLTCNLDALFKEKYPKLKIGFSKFAELRPKQCVLALDKHGTHSVCACVYHQNVQLIFKPLHRMKIFDESIHTYEDILKRMVCLNSNAACHLNQCVDCPGVGEMENQWTERFEAENTDEVKFKQWIISGSSKYM